MSDAPKAIITWNVTNWITVVLMAVLGFAVLNGVAAFAVKVKNKAASDAG